MKSTRIFLPTFLLLVFACGASQLGLAKKDMAAGQYENAITVLRAETIARPTNANAFLLLAECYEKTDNADSAIAGYQHVLDLDAGNRKASTSLVQLYIARGNTARESGSLRMALENYENAEKLSPNLLDIHYERAIAFQKFNLLDKSQAALQKAAEISPNDPRIQAKTSEMASAAGQAEQLYQKGVNLYNENRWDQAIKVLDQAVSLNAGHVDAKYTLHLVRGRRLYKKGSVSAVWDAITEFGHASVLRPDAAEPLYYMAQAYEKKNRDDYDLTVETYQKVIEIAPNSDYAKKSQKRLKFLQNRKEKMEKFWGKKKN
ncbi:MAG: tetratricopeptide repeat protein [bacterium]